MLIRLVTVVAVVAAAVAVAVVIRFVRLRIQAAQAHRRHSEFGARVMHSVFAETRYAEDLDTHPARL